MFNLFRQVEEPTIICALPEGGRMPSFLRDRGWRYAGKIDDIRHDQLAFDRPSVKTLVERQGFYLYTQI